jgi:Hemerythrin HHE cation binding domain
VQGTGPAISVRQPTDAVGAGVYGPPRLPLPLLRQTNSASPSLRPGRTMTAIHSTAKTSTRTPGTAAGPHAPRAGAASRTHAGPKDALALLSADHVAVSQLFADYRGTRSVPYKKDLVAEICLLLSVHAQIEEEIFYPEVQCALQDIVRMPTAQVEHAGMKALIAQLEGAEPDGARYDAQVQVLADYVRHHIKEEQAEMFPRARASSLDLLELGARMAARKEVLMARAG